MSKNRNGKTKHDFKDVFKKGDVLLLLVVIVLVALTIAFSVTEKATVAEIYIDGSLAYRVDLTKDATFDILDGKMTVAVKDGRIYVAKSDCKEQLCTHASPIGNKGGTIVCLPNKVVITISAKEIDAIT